MLTRQGGRPGILADDHDSCYWIGTVSVKEKLKRWETLFEGIEGREHVGTLNVGRFQGWEKAARGRGTRGQEA